VDEDEGALELVQTTGRALRDKASKKKVRGKEGYGRCTGGRGYAKQKMGKYGKLFGKDIPHECGPRGGRKNRFLFTVKASSVHGHGLYARCAIRKGAVLGFFTGTRMDTRDAEALHKQGRSKSLVGVPYDGDWVWWDASKGHKCIFSWINSCAGLSVAPSVRFEAGATRLVVVANTNIKVEQELLADYQFDVTKKLRTK
jgi:hypothetical protein